MQKAYLFYVGIQQTFMKVYFLAWQLIVQCMTLYVCVCICRTEGCRNWKDYFNEQFLAFTILYKTTRQRNTRESVDWI